MRVRSILPAVALVISVALQLVTIGRGEASKDEAPPKAPPATAPAHDPRISTEHHALLVGLLAKVGAERAKLDVVERTPERQTRVMYDLAKEDLAHAQDMYCSAGDAVLEVFDPKRSEADNLARMQAELMSQLPAARELGCLNHIKNDDVYAVDVAVELVDESKHSSLIQHAKAAVESGQLARFLHPPRHPGAFHFELARKPEASNETQQAPTRQ